MRCRAQLASMIAWAGIIGTLTLTLATALAIAVATTSAATNYTTVCLRSTISEGTECPGHLIAKFDARVTPKKLPAHTLAPVALNLSAQISTTDATHPSALRELTIDLDRNIAIDARGLPVCHPSSQRGIPALTSQADPALRRSCRRAVVGDGTANFGIRKSQTTIPAEGKLIAYNGGTKDGVTILYAVSYLHLGALRQIVVPVRITTMHNGRYRLRAVAKIPRVAGGHGSLLDFHLKLKRLFAYKHAKHSYASAKCPDGHLDAEITSLSRNETKMSGVPSQTTLKGTVIRPCTPKLSSSRM